MKNLRGFEVSSPDEEKVQSFLKSIDAVDTAIESGWNTVIMGQEDDPDEFQGFGYTTLSPEELNRFSHLLGVELVYVDEPLTTETARSLGLWQYVEEAG